jgi:hypothetical protein
VPQPAERQRTRHQIKAALVFTWADFAKVFNPTHFRRNNRSPTIRANTTAVYIVNTVNSGPGGLSIRKPLIQSSAKPANATTGAITDVMTMHLISPLVILSTMLIIASLSFFMVVSVTQRRRRSLKSSLRVYRIRRCHHGQIICRTAIKNDSGAILRSGPVG